MNKKKLALLCGVLVLIIISVWWFKPYWYKENDNKITLYGNVDIRQISLAFDTSARVAEMRVEEGEHVTAGQVIATLDAENTRLKLEQAKAQADVASQTLLALRNGNRPEEIKQSAAQVKATQAEVERTKIYWQRLQSSSNLSEGQAVSKQEIDNARTAYRAAQAQYDAAQQAYKLVRTGARQEDIAKAQAQLSAAQAEQALLQHTLDQSELRAPKNAVVRSRLLEPGEIASPTRPAYTLALTDPKWIRAYINEPQLGLIKPNMQAKIMTDSFPNKAINGKVIYISSVAEFTPKNVQTTDIRTDLVYEIRILVEDPNDILRLGMPVTIDIELPNTQK